VPDYLVRGTVTYRIIIDQIGSVRQVVNDKYAHDDPINRSETERP
jgi:hypothetical protein